MTTTGSKCLFLFSILTLSRAAMADCGPATFNGNYQTSDYQEAEFAQCQADQRQQQRQTWDAQEAQQREQQQEQHQWDNESRELRQGL